MVKKVNVPTDAQLPLVLDLDGTVLKTDLLLECLLLSIKRSPFVVFMVMVWLFQGRAVLKQKLAQRAGLDVDGLPLNDALVAYAAACHAAGQPVYIASAANADLARQVGDRLGFVTEVLGSSDRLNLKGRHKAAALVARFPNGFIYAGDDPADIDVWAVSSGAVFAGRSASVERAAAKVAPMVATFRQARVGLKVWIKALRLHQWSKNALVFMPLMLAGLLASGSSWTNAILAFLAIGLVSSSTYLLNDLLDLKDDRAHATKHRRPLASGALPIGRALVAMPLGIGAGFALGWLSNGWPTLLCLLGYLVTTLAYSFKMKRWPVVDVLVIAGLFTSRMLLGALAVDAPVRPWLFVFSMFLFTGLSMAKRVVEVQRLMSEGKVGGRGYLATDGPIIMAMGVAANVAAILVLVLYLIEEAFTNSFYGQAGMLWFAPMVLTLWLGRVWLLCARGELDDDPVAFAVRDPISVGLGAFLGLSVVGAVLL
ncbi:UbiA family prenyltransferase [Brevundimonas sp.]|uniref:UbiA family prenyltransferase n=1 Tax=Brevundimonas sp. TaxID=1871086 RepID=UPI002ABA61D2|nr:UbiA family prenyltransferase [Brevundimonas sp.]MDZ4364339.1 UbiA family prenyltransferase [Brevundimonas sp.]